MMTKHVSNYEKLVNRFGMLNAPLTAARADGATVTLTHYLHEKTAGHFVLQFKAPDGRILGTSWFHKEDIVAGVCIERPLNVDQVAALFGI